MNQRKLQRMRDLRPSERGAMPAHALPVNLRVDLTQFLRPPALDDDETEAWISEVARRAQ